jgi:hypothetical protein
MAPEVAAAWIAGCFSVAAGAFALVHAHRTERLKSDLQDQLSEKNARREYVYEARQRLYRAVAPSMFQLTELADGGLAGVRCLCDPDQRASFRIADGRRESLQTKGFIGTTSYEVVQATYAMLAPLAIFRMLQRRITTFDLSLDRQIYAQWCLVRASYQTAQRDKEIARLTPALEYDPDVPDWRLRRIERPRVHWLQGITRGRLDNAIDLLVVAEGAHPRLATFGEFERRFLHAAAAGGDDEKLLGVFANPLFDYSPNERPVFFRLLAVQAALYRALFRTGTRSEADIALGDVADWLRLDDDLVALFDQPGGESVIDLQHVTRSYLETYVLSAFVAPHLAAEARPDGSRGDVAKPR